jgi:hypothetical protein
MAQLSAPFVFGCSADAGAQPALAGAPRPACLFTFKSGIKRREQREYLLSGVREQMTAGAGGITAKASITT